MANPCTPCNCIPYINRLSCLPVKGIWITMPSCHVVPGQVIPVNNPCFDGEKSYWTYKMFIDCSTDDASRAGALVIPVSNAIPSTDINVFEKINGCMEFVQRPFALRTNIIEDNAVKDAPQGFQYVVIDAGERFLTGVCVEYRIEIQGDYPEVAQDIKVITDTANVSGRSIGSFLVPGSPLPAELSVKKECQTALVNGLPMLQYRTTITNSGGSRADNLQILDTVGFDGMNISLGTLELQQQELSMNVETLPSMIEISGALGDIEPGNSVTFGYDIPVVDLKQTGTYQFSSILNAFNSRGIFKQTNCVFQLKTMELSAQMKSSISDNRKLTFTLEINSGSNSPATVVDIQDQLVIPEGATVKVINLGNCTAKLPDGTSVTAGSVLSGVPEGTTVLIDCANKLVTSGEIVTETIELELLSLSIFGESVTISNSITSIMGKALAETVVNNTGAADNAEAETLLVVKNVPVSSNVTIIGNVSV